MLIPTKVTQKDLDDKEKVAQMILDRTGDLGGGGSLVERLQRLLDLPCEICDDGRVVERLKVLARNLIRCIEDMTNESIIGTDIELEVGITEEEYDDLMG